MRYVVDRKRRIDGNEARRTGTAVKCNQRQRLRLEYIQSRLNRRAAIVFTLHQHTAVFVVDSRLLRRIEAFVIDASVARIGPPPKKSFFEKRTFDFKIDCLRNSATAALQERIQRLRLRNRARKPIEEYRRIAVQFTLHHCDNQLIRNKFTALHVPLRGESDAAALRAVLAQQITGRNSLISELRAENLCLRSLPRARTPEKDDIATVQRLIKPR